MLYTTIDSPVGELLLAGDGDALARLTFHAGGRARAFSAGWEHRPDAFPAARAQLEQYFAVARRSFELKLDLRGNPFEQSVWSALLEIPYGDTRSYGEIAAQVGAPTAARAVGVANARNPVAIIVPCHRVIGADGTLTGYGGGLERKRHLLDLEAGVAQLSI